MPASVRPELEGFYRTRIGVVTTEIALRRGNMEPARKRLSELVQTYNSLSPIFRRIVLSHCYVSLYNEYYSIVINSYDTVACHVYELRQSSTDSWIHERVDEPSDPACSSSTYIE